MSSLWTGSWWLRSRVTLALFSCLEPPSRKHTGSKGGKAATEMRVVAARVQHLDLLMPKEPLPGTDPSLGLPEQRYPHSGVVVFYRVDYE